VYNIIDGKIMCEEGGGDRARAKEKKSIPYTKLKKAYVFFAIAHNHTYSRRTLLSTANTFTQSESE
jgi:hypothetical protein